MEIGVRAQNWLRELEKQDVAKEAGASLLPICAANDEAADEVRAALAERFPPAPRQRSAIVEDAGMICLRLSSGDEQFQPPAAEAQGLGTIDLSAPGAAEAVATIQAHVDDHPAIRAFAELLGIAPREQVSPPNKQQSK